MPRLKGDTQTYELHGSGRIPFPAPLDYPGGIFGGPVMPIERAGMFKSHWALPSDDIHDVTIAGPLFSPATPPDYAIRPSGAPIIGLAAAPSGEAAGLTAGPLAPLFGAGIGAAIGAMGSTQAKRSAGALVGALAGAAGQVVGSSVFRPPLLALAMAGLGGYVAAMMVGKGKG